MWVSSSVCFLVGSAFVVPPPSSPLHFRHAAVSPFNGLRRCRSDLRLAVADDDFPETETQNIFIRAPEIRAWLRKMQKTNPSLVKKLEKALGTGHSDDSAWMNLFPSDFLDRLANNSTTTGKDFATFFDFAKRALQSVHENNESVHENNEIDLNEATLAEKICLWVQYLREELVTPIYSTLTVTELKVICKQRSLKVSGRKATLIERIVKGDIPQKEEQQKQEATPTDSNPADDKPADDKPADDKPADDKPADDKPAEGGPDPSKTDSAEKKTIFAVEEEARELGRKDNRLALFEMTLRLQDPENSQVINLLKDPPVSINESQSDGPPLCYGSEKCEVIDLSVRRKGETDLKSKGLFPDEDNMVKAEDARKAFVALNLSAKTNKDLVKELVDRLESTLTNEKTYRDKLVDLSGTEKVRFAQFPGKSRVVIVAGESGSGKTTFSQYGIKRLAGTGDLTSTAVMHYSLDKKAGPIFKGKEEEDLSDEDAAVKMLISQSLRRFKDSRGEEGIQDSAEEAPYNLVSSLNTVLNKERNDLARSVFDDSIKRFFVEKGDDESREWWEGRREELVLDGLIIVLDEAGRNRKFVRGLVDIGRELVREVVGGTRGDDGLPQRAKQCMIALAGAGLDVVDEAFQEAYEITDPDKAAIVIAKKVDFESPDFAPYLGKVKSEEILKGTISSVLAENTRMLAGAILPSFNCKPLTKNYDNIYDSSLQTKHRIAAGSSSFFMNYAARVFVANNGLGELKPKEIEEIFECAFRFFLQGALKGIREDAALVASARKSLLDELSRKEKKIDERIFFYGVANRGQATSKAMRFLSCLGSAFALVDGDGLLFEKAVSVHLARLSTCLGRKHLGIYQLKTSLPTTKRKFSTKKSIGDVKSIREMFPRRTDVLREKGPWSLIMIQVAKNPPGPDVMELQLYAQDNGCVRGVLDLYQSKYTKDSHTPSTLKDAAVTLGRSPADMGLDDDSRSKAERVRNAPLVRNCLDKFVNKLGEEFGIEIAIGKRVIVIKPPAKPDDLKRSMKVVLGGGVTVWTSEFLEPTCSLFEP